MRNRACRTRTLFSIPALFLLSVSLLGACSARVKPDASGDVVLDRLTPAESSRMKLGEDQVFVPGELINSEVKPVYPRELLPLHLPDQAVCVSFVVSVEGSVSDIAPVLGVTGCPASADSTRPEFASAARDAVSRWEFFSSIRCTFPASTLEAHGCSGPGVVQEPVAITLAYRFFFSTKFDSATVERSAAHD